MFFTASNGWLWEACRISVREISLAGRRQNRPVGFFIWHSFPRRPKNIQPLALLPRCLHSHHSLLLPQHTHWPRWWTPPLFWLTLREVFWVVWNQDLNFYRETWLFRQKTHSLIKYKQSSRSTIYCWQLIRLNSSGGQGQHLYWAMFREQFVRSEPPQRLPASSAQIAGEGVMGVYYLCSPLKTNPTKEQSFPSAGNC